jgi:putative addiction module component (TIGR02574 family)
MSKEKLMAEILRLPPEDRQALIHETIDSLPKEYVVDREMTPELREELNRRYREMLAHPERESSWEEVSARMRSKSARS